MCVVVDAFERAYFALRLAKARVLAEWITEERTACARASTRSGI